MLKTPGYSDGGPEVLDQALVGVDCWGDQRHDISEAGEDASEKMDGRGGEVCEVVVLGVWVWFWTRKDICARGVDQGDCDIPFLLMPSRCPR